jgi:hypothetical protein
MHLQSQPATAIPGSAGPRPTADRHIRFDRNELAGAFGDIGTDLPLLVGMVLAAGLDVTGVLVAFGALQVATGLLYRMPMPVQPLKAMAAIVIAQGIPADVLLGGGLAIGVLMLALSAAGLLEWIGRVVPRPVVRGLQLGLALQLARIAVLDFVPSLGIPGYVLAAATGLIVLALIGNRRVPPAPIVIAIGIGFALYTAVSPREIVAGFGPRLPSVDAPSWSAIAAGLVMLALPQLPLSIGNSILATRQLAEDLFPARPPLTLRRIGFTYAAMNLVGPWFGGVPTCHGSGGLAGHYAHGGRTGGSVVIYGLFYLVTGLLFSEAFTVIVRVFPLPILGVLLAVEALVLVRLLRDLRLRVPAELPLAMLVGMIAAFTPYGYLTGMVVGAALAAALRRRGKAGGGTQRLA